MQIVAKLNKASWRRAGRALSGPFLLLVVACLPASAQDNWSYAVAPYLWVASVEADTSLPSLSVQSVRQLGEETGTAVDQRRFRANVYLDFTTASGFGENQFVG